MNQYNIYPLIYNLLKYHISFQLVSWSNSNGYFIFIIHLYIIVYFQTWISQIDSCVG